MLKSDYYMECSERGNHRLLDVRGKLGIWGGEGNRWTYILPSDIIFLRRTDGENGNHCSGQGDV